MADSSHTKRKAVDKVASRYHLPGKRSGTYIAFGIDRLFGRWFQYWPNDGEPSVDEDRLSQTEIVALLKEYGKPSKDLEKAVSALIMDLDPSRAGLRSASARTEGETSDLLPVERAARYHEGPEGRKEFKEDMKKDPAFAKKWKKQTEEHRDEFTMGDEEAMMLKTDEAPVLPVEAELLRLAQEDAARDRLTRQAREAAGGLYGFTKKTQADIESTVKKAKKRAAVIAKALHAKDERSVHFLATHAKRGKSASAKLLLQAMKDVSRIASERLAFSADQERLYDSIWLIASNDGDAYSAGDVKGAIQNAYSRHASNRREGMRDDFRAIKARITSDLDKYWAGTRQASKTAGATPLGMYGFPTKTARMCLNACTDLRSGIGEIGHDLHTRRQARWDRLTDFMRQHTKKARCAYTRMLLASYPDPPVLEDGRVAAGAEGDWWNPNWKPKEAGKIPKALEKHQFGPGGAKGKGKKDDKDEDDDKSDKKKDDGKMPAELLEKFKGKKKARWTPPESTDSIVEAWASTLRDGESANARDVARATGAPELGVEYALDRLVSRGVLTKDRNYYTKLAKRKAPPKEHQFTSEDNPNPKGNDRDGDGKTNEKKDKKASSVSSEALRAVLALEQDPERVAGLLYNMLLYWQYGPDDISEDFARLSRPLHLGLIPEPPRPVFQRAMKSVSTPDSMKEFLAVALGSVGEPQMAAQSRQLIRTAKRKAPPKEHQFTSEDNPNPKGNDRDGDGKTNEKKPFKEAAVLAKDIKPGDEVKVGKLTGRVERVREVDAWVDFPEGKGASWVPLKNITLKNASVDPLVAAWGSLLPKTAQFDPNQIGAKEPGTLVYEVGDDKYPGEFTEQEFTELSDKQEGGVIQDGKADKQAAPNDVAGWLEWQE